MCFFWGGLGWFFGFLCVRGGWGVGMESYLLKNLAAGNQGE